MALFVALVAALLLTSGTANAAATTPTVKPTTTNANKPTTTNANKPTSPPDQVDKDHNWGQGTLPAPSSSSVGKTGAGVSAACVGNVIASDFCVYNGQKYAVGYKYTVPAAGNCGKCAPKTMTFWCESATSYTYCCGNQCKYHNPSMSA